MVDVQSFSAGNLKPPSVQAHPVQYSRVDVGDVVAVVVGMKTELIGRAVDVSAFDATSSKEHGEAMRVVVSPVGPAATFFDSRSATELGAEDDKG